MAHARVQAAISRLNDEMTRVFGLDSPIYSRYSASPPYREAYDSDDELTVEYEYEYQLPSDSPSRKGPAQPYARVRTDSSPKSAARSRYPDIEDVYSSPTQAVAPRGFNLCQSGGVCCGGGCGKASVNQQSTTDPSLFSRPIAGYATTSPFVQEKVFLREAAAHRHRSEHQSFCSAGYASKRPLDLEEFLRLQRLNLESMDRHLHHVEDVVHNQLLTSRV